MKKFKGMLNEVQARYRPTNINRFKVSSSADGTSYMPAVVVPIPIIAPVQADACKAMAFQLNNFFGTK